ncbi:zf-HC2 domain-containing protein [Kineosporia rhizophila]|uniref:zf-HC2 domain-containing protein n=1 Tax=Kineosporia rhizophila TaxID=84633 RepID=UPI001E48E8AC|nr:zf-HC2 domain-containing protein [Kineosporia rhizophila]MCE0538769.1 zf-HC2 domain-containing protein [Kineosporia rhizophila]
MTPHPSPAVLARYADREAELPEVTSWAVEVHLETCADCRAELATSSDDLLARVAVNLDAAIAAGPAPAPQRHWSVALNRWFVWALLPWLTMALVLLGCAVLIQRLVPDFPQPVLLLAPIAPLPAVAGAWSRRFDPAWELIAATPTAGLTMLLRRTATALAVIVPALALTGAPLALALLPCLAFTAASLVLGAFVGVRRAAAGLGALWTLAVITPTVMNTDLPTVLQPGAAPGWALTTLALTGLAGLLATRTDYFHRLSSTR